MDTLDASHCKNDIDMSVFIWMLLGFLFSFLLFFVHPIFFSASIMQFPKIIPIADSIGVDLYQMLSYSESWWNARETPYIGNNLYPPLASVLFSPLLLLDFSLAYRIFSLINLFLYILAVLILPILISEKRQFSPLLMLVFVTGLFSYGLIFELERGQFNLFSVSLSLLGIWIYHAHHKYRYLAYLLFIISVQLKVFPFIFIVMFVRNWKDWNSNFRRILFLSVLNVGLFFVLGPIVFIEFIAAIKAQAIAPAIWGGNHSIFSFVVIASLILAELGWQADGTIIQIFQWILLVFVIFCVFVIIAHSYRYHNEGIDHYLLLACTIGALVIPSVSHDYKLSILIAPIAILLSSNVLSSLETASSFRGILQRLMVFVFSMAYFSTMFSYTNKPFVLQNNFPALAIILLVVTYLSTTARQK
jgi:hypothetical protein